MQDITSGDAQRIWASSSAIVHLREPETLEALCTHISEIKEKTSGIALGGALFPNSERLKFAIRKLVYYRDKAGCLCRLYPEYVMYDPKTEAKEGHVRLISTRFVEKEWADSYTCECTLCGTVFLVSEREYHYTWWGWTITEEGIQTTRTKHSH